jgi:hypothetical protein
MIGINVISIAQSVNLASGQLNNILVLQLPDGTEVNAIVPEAVVDKIYGLVNGSQPQQPAPQPPAPPQAPPQEVPKTAAPAPTQSPEGKMEVNWMELDEEYLPAHLKSALKYLNVPEVLSTTAIRNLLNQIGERFGDEQWAEVMHKYPNGPYENPMPQQTPQPAPQPPRAVRGAGLQPPQQAPQPQPPLAQVQWSDGSPMIPGQGNRGRTVPANSAGFPMTGDNSMDPGEVVGGSSADVDEDGVGQF